MTQPRSAGFAFAFVLGLELAFGLRPASAQDLAATPPPLASAPTVLSSEPAPGTTVGALREIEV
ncbi:MAG: hypothetical protein JNL97_07095, partial [Verrucomicrobiales bacterium]|nr:hypothetical protein [Verrucomicrobiales bacterium]